MKFPSESARRRYVRLGLVLLVSLCFWAGSSDTVRAQSETQVVRVEEDWELVLGTPDADSDAPQVTCVISPVGNVKSVHAAFSVNHQSLPEFVAGGLQLQVWDDELQLGSRKFPNGSVMQQPGETVRWTQCMELVEGTLVFEIRTGTSATWSNFGGQGYLKTAVSSTLANLNGYNPAVSVANSGVGYAGNRVESLVLRSIRLTTSTGEVLESNAEYIVYPRQ